MLLWKLPKYLPPPNSNQENQTAMAWAQLAATRAPLVSPTFASHSSKRSRRRINDSPSPSSSSRRKQPSVAEVQRAIGLVDDDDALRMMKAADPSSSSSSSSSGSSSSPSSLLDLLSSTPIGQAEGPAERKLREVAEWVVDQTEANAKSGNLFELVIQYCFCIQLKNHV